MAPAGLAEQSRRIGHIATKQRKEHSLPKERVTRRAGPEPEDFVNLVAVHVVILVQPPEQRLGKRLGASQSAVVVSRMVDLQRQIGEVIRILKR